MRSQSKLPPDDAAAGPTENGARHGDPGQRQPLPLPPRIREDARANLPDTVWDYLVGGTETETTLRRNRQALDAIAFRPRVLRNVAHVQTANPVLGKPSRLPLMLAPVGSLENFTPDGGAAAARAAAAFGVPIVVSSVTAPGLEATAAANGAGRRIFQLYTRGDDAYIDDHVRRAVDSGYEMFCITVDSAAYSRRERDLAKRHVRAWRLTATGMEFQSAFAWDNVKRFKDRHAVPLMLKGIQTAEDAAIACEHGVDVVWASNHGGRQLDHCPGAMEILPEIVHAVAGRAPVVIDGGFSRATDILKALALGRGQRRRRASLLLRARGRRRGRAGAHARSAGDGARRRHEAARHHQPRRTRCDLRAAGRAGRPAGRPRRVPADRPVPQEAATTPRAEARPLLAGHDAFTET